MYAKDSGLDSVRHQPARRLQISIEQHLDVGHP